MNKFDISIIIIKIAIVVSFYMGAKQIAISDKMPLLGDLIDSEICERDGAFFEDNNSVSLITDIRCPNDTEFRTISFPCYDSCKYERFEETDDVYNSIVIYTFSPNNYKTIAGSIPDKKTQIKIFGILYIIASIIASIGLYFYQDKPTQEVPQPKKKKNTRRSVV